MIGPVQPAGGRGIPGSIEGERENYIRGRMQLRVLLFAVFLSVSPNSTPPKWYIASLAYGSGLVSDWSRAGKFKWLQLVICYNFVQPYFENMGCENWVPLPKHSKADSETLLWWKPWETLHIDLGQLYNVSLISFQLCCL